MVRTCEMQYCIKIHFQVDSLKNTFCTAYLKKHDFNLITVDWSGPANNYIYSIPASKTTGVGQIIARLLNILVKLMLVIWKNIHIIGHSLGGHVMGAAGGNTEEKVARLSGVALIYVFSNRIFKSDCSLMLGTHFELFVFYVFH